MVCGRRPVLRIEEFATSSSRQEPPMTEMAIRPLRRRMIEDMTVRNFVEKTRNDYIRHVKNLTAFLGRPPDTATAEELRRLLAAEKRPYGLLPKRANGLNRSRGRRPAWCMSRHDGRSLVWR